MRKMYWEDELRELLRPPQPIRHFTEIIAYPLIKYPDSYNKYLSLSLQKSLDAMSPSEYLSYVLHDLTLDERESLLVDERQRLKTFLANWPHEHKNGLSGAIMARNGFYYLNDSDRVQCVFCRGSIKDWSSGDDVLREHGVSFSFCRFIKGIECGNRPYKSEKLCKEDLANIDVYPHSLGNTASSNTKDIEHDCEVLGISTNRASTIRYAPYASRIRTFTKWPTHCLVKAEDVCEAGFYYTGFSDSARCFYCSGNIRDWGPGDDPWTEHARFPDCNFLLYAKGQDFVDKIHEATPESMKSIRKVIKKRNTKRQQQKPLRRKPPL
ncbi:Iap2 [Bugula neritina]|uniref:Iap2 n=1 Tax=Bugula neritina TaxID=10212 RepID=A0A7J7KCD4_BUGNE|nr:Iap2 [Bugula neritina]